MGYPAWEPSRLSGAKWAGETPAGPPLILWSWRDPPIICLPSSLPPMPLGTMRLEGILENGGPGLGAQQSSQAWKSGGNTLCTSLDPPVLEGPSRQLLLFSPHLPPTPLGPTWPGGGLGGWRTRPGSPTGFPGPIGQGNFLEDQGPSRRGNPSPLPATPQGRQSCPAFTVPPLSLSLRPTWSLRGSSCLLRCSGPPLASGRRPSFGETRTPRPPPLPS